MPAELLATYHSTAPSTTHTVPLGGSRTNGRTVLAIGFCKGEIGTAVPAPWKISHSAELATVDARIWRLPPEDNNGTVTEMPFIFSTPRSMTCVIWEDDVDTAVYYTDLRNTGPAPGDPFTIGTRNHTFAVAPESFAIYIVWGADTANLTADLVSYDGGYADFADSGSTINFDPGDFPSRIFMAQATGVGQTNTGVTATANDDASATNVVDGITGMMAYQVLTAAPPINMVAPSLAGTPETNETIACLQGAWRNGPDTYAFQWQRSTNGGSSWSNISGATASAYTLDMVDEGALIRCAVASSNEFGSATTPSNSITAGPAPVQGDLFAKVGGEFVPLTTRTLVSGSWVGAT